jgi:hypothetical protein
MIYFRLFPRRHREVRPVTSLDSLDSAMKYSNEASIPGPASDDGVGILDIDRVMNREIPGILGVAITSLRISHSQTSGESDQIQVTV